jgi:hypothetical protein
VLVALGLDSELLVSIDGGLACLSLVLLLEAGLRSGAGLISTYKLDDTSGVARLLAVEQETLSGLGSPGGNVVGSLGSLLSLQVGGKLLGGDGLRAEPELLAGVDEVPFRSKLALDLRVLDR